MNKKLIFILVAALSLTACTRTHKVTEWPQVLFAGDYPDPSILVDGHDYYMAFTSNYWLPGLPVWHSTDLVNWEQISNAVTKYIGTVWAPDLQKIDGKYVIYFPADGRVFAVTADDMRGPWSAPIDMGVRAIDPGYIEDAEGHRALFYNGGIMTDLTADGLHVDGDIRHAYDAWPIPDDWVVECTCLESPKLLEHDGWYYITSAEGGTAGPATSHMAVVHRSRSINGPWEPSPYNPVIHTYSADEQWWSKGHGTIFCDAKEQWWIVYHAYRKGYHTLGRHALIEPIKWTEDGWPVADPTAERKMAVRKPTNELHWMSWRGNDAMQTIITGDTCYTYSARVTVTGEMGGTSGISLSYNVSKYTGMTTDGHHIHLYHEGRMVGEEHNEWGNTIVMKIINDCHNVTFYAGPDDQHLERVGETYDVSGMHHNNLGSFMSLRPALRKGDGAVIDDIHYYPGVK